MQSRGGALTDCDTVAQARCDAGGGDAGGGAGGPWRPPRCPALHPRTRGRLARNEGIPVSGVRRGVWFILTLNRAVQEHIKELGR